MDTPMEASLIGGLTALTALLDSLRAEQDPIHLSKVLRSAFAERELCKVYLSFAGEDQEKARVLLEVFDKALTVPQQDIKIFKKFRQLCGRAGLLPASHILSDALTRTTEHPVAFGTFGDVWEGICGDTRVAVKALRVYKDEDVRKVRKVFCKEVAMWRRISHPNIVPFLGVSESPAPLSMVSEWMPNGNVRSYITNNPDISRLQMLLDISNGLSFLHANEIVHGDLKGDNILIDKSGYARLNDFGFTNISSLNCTETSENGSKGTYRWMAPELLDVQQTSATSGALTPQSDIFAFGMVAIEVFTGKVPFPNNTYIVVTKKITDGERPPRPPKTTRLGLSDELWAMIQSSWASKAEDRPSASAFVELLERANPDMTLLEELENFDANSDDHLAKLEYVFGYGENTLLGMREDETLVLIEVFDRVLNSSLDDGKMRSQCLRGLQRISARCGLLPKSYFIDKSSLTQPDTTSPTTGRISDTCQQRLMDGQLVAVKTFSPGHVENFNVLKHRLCTGAVVWKRLKHPNVASFLGFGSDTLSSLVYPWMPNGNLSEYLREYPDVDKLNLLLDIAQGLTYLHQYNVVHGNLTGHNILVDSDGTACISEYGLELPLRGRTSESVRPNVRWMAPEVISASEKYKRVKAYDGKQADVYSFGVVVFEVLTGSIPFPDENDDEIVDRVTAGLRPEWPPNNPSQGLVSALWDQIGVCWSHDPGERPTALMMLQFLHALSRERAQEKSQEARELLESFGDDTWDHIDAGELDDKRHKEHPSLSGSTLVDGSSGRRLFPFPHSDGNVSKRDPPQRRRDRVKRHVRHLLHLSRPGSPAAEMNERSKPEIEIVEKREENVQVSDGSVPYLTSKPVPNGKKLKKVVITVVSKDQGWSSYQDDHGTYRNSWTWFELSVGPPSDSKGATEKWRGEVVRNLHAHGDFKEHTIEITDEGLYANAGSGDVLKVWAHARFPGWRNTVNKATIRYVVE